MKIAPEEIKAYLRIDTTNTDEDTILNTILNSAISFCETYLNRPILDENMDDSNRWVVPSDIKIAIYLLCTHWYENRSAVTIGPVSKELEFSVSAILSPHRYRQV